MSRARVYKEISQLNDSQKQHLAYRLEKLTEMTSELALKWVQGEMGDINLVTLFEEAGLSKHASRINATKAQEFRPPVIMAAGKPKLDTLTQIK